MPSLPSSWGACSSAAAFLPCLGFIGVALALGAAGSSADSSVGSLRPSCSWALVRGVGTTWYLSTCWG